MRQELFYHVQRQSFRFFDNTKTGNIMSRISNDLFEIGELAHHGPEDFFIAIMTFIGAFGIMLTINVKLAIVNHSHRPLSCLGHCFLQYTHEPGMEGHVYKNCRY